MARLTTLLMIILAIEIGMAIVGIDTGAKLLYDTFLEIQTSPNAFLSTLLASIFDQAALFALGTGTIVAGAALLSGRLDIAIAAVFVTFFGVFIMDLVAIISYFDVNYTGNPIGYVISIVFGLLVFLFAMALIEWWLNR